MLRRAAARAASGPSLSRSLAVLVLADPPASATSGLTAGTLSAVTAAAALGAGPLDLLLTGAHAQAAAAAAARVAGVQRVFVSSAATGGVAAHSPAEAVTAVALRLHAAHAYSHVVAVASNHGRNVAPRLAAKLDTAPISDVTRVVDARTFERPLYAGSIVATVRVNDDAAGSAKAPVVLTVRPTAFAKVAAEGGAASSEAAPAPSAAEAAAAPACLAEEQAASERPELSAASKVVSGGRALKSAENFKMLYALADALGAGTAVGASRAAVDAGYAPNDLQVGQTGKIVAPALYVAVGVSGAIQHLAGMKDSKVIVAINKDAEAPIFQVADLGLVADLFVAVPELTAKVGAVKAAAK